MWQIFYVTNLPSGENFGKEIIQEILPLLYFESEATAIAYSCISTDFS